MPHQHSFQQVGVELPFWLVSIHRKELELQSIQHIMIHCYSIFMMSMKRSVLPNLQETSSLKVKHYLREEGVCHPIKDVGNS